MSAENATATNVTGTDIEKLIPLQQHHPAKKALKQRASRPAQKKGGYIAFLGAVLIYSPFIASKFPHPVWMSVLLMATSFVGIVMFFTGLVLSVRAEDKLKCKSCGTPSVRTPYCPFCGTFDPLDDYEEWLQREAAKPAKKSFWRLRRG